MQEPRPLGWTDEQWAAYCRRQDIVESLRIFDATRLAAHETHAANGTVAEDEAIYRERRAEFVARLQEAESAFVALMQEGDRNASTGA